MKYFLLGFWIGFTNMRWALRGAIAGVICYIIWRALT
jgi:hypothetical protein